MNFYPKAHINRVSPNNPRIISKRLAFLKAAAINFGILQVLFLLLFAYCFGSLYQQTSRTHNINILFVDYDGAAVGNAVRTAYTILQGASFPTVVERPADEFKEQSSLREEVCKGRYWGAVFTAPLASQRLQDALSGTIAAEDYNKSDVVSYFWNEARYSPIVDAVISGNIQTISSAARVNYLKGDGSRDVLSVSQNNTAAIEVFAQPWDLVSLNIQPTTQGSRQIYNTLVIILILVQEFFYLGTINGLYIQFKIYSNLHPHRIIVFRNLISGAYTFIGALCTAGMVWAFRSGWHVNGNQFALTWAILWLFAHINFLTLDVFTIWTPAPYIPMAFISWLILNVTSVLLPFELSNPFYRWAYAMPAYETYQVLTDIWSGGCNPKLSHALPVLFSLEVSGLIISAIGVYRRCHYAVIAEEMEQEKLQGRVNAALAFERRRSTEKEEAKSKFQAGQNQDSQDDIGIAEPSTPGDIREELTEAIRQENNEIKRIQSNMNKSINFGPCFNLPFEGSSDGQKSERRGSKFSRP